MGMEVVQTQDFGPHLRVAVRTIVSPDGQGQGENEDNYLLIDRDGLARRLCGHRDQYLRLGHWRAGHVRVAVLDGMGGQGHGREVAEAVTAGLCELPPQYDQPSLNQALDSLHLRLHERFRSLRPQPGCTLSLLEIPAEGPALLFHVGDSRLYRIDARKVQCLTLDQVPATQAALQGRMTEAEWRRQVHRETRFILSQAFVLGSSLREDPALRAELLELTDERLPPFLRGLGDRRPIPLDREATYLLGTDGLWSQAEPQPALERWPNLFRNRASPLNHRLDDLFIDLMTRHRPEDHADNCTAVAIEIFPGSD